MKCLAYLFQIIVNQFIVVKKTWYNLITLVVGAIVNIVINYILIRKIGIEGAAIGTLFGYVVSIILAAIILVKMNLLKIFHRFYFILSVFLIYFIGWRFSFRENIFVGLASVFIICGIYVSVYWQDIKRIIRR